MRFTFASVPPRTNTNEAILSLSPFISGKPGNACKFTNGTGRCSKSVCTYTDCDANYALVDNSCSQLNTDTDVNNWYVYQACRRCSSDVLT